MSKEYDDYKGRAGKRPPSSGKKKFGLVVGDNEFRIAKTPKGKKSPSVWMEVAMHSDVGSEKKYLRCGKDPETAKGNCYICDKVIPRLLKRGKDSRASALQPQTKLIVQVWPVINGKPKGPAKIFEPSKKVGDNIMTLINNKKRDVVDHVKGYNLTINRTGTQKNDTRYSAIEKDDDPSKVPSELVEKLVPFDRHPDLYPYDEKMMKAALGESSGDDDDEDDEPKKKRRGRDDDDEDEDDDEDDNDSDDEDDDGDGE